MLLLHLLTQIGWTINSNKVYPLFYMHYCAEPRLCEAHKGSYYILQLRGSYTGIWCAILAGGCEIFIFKRRCCCPLGNLLTRGCNTRIRSALSFSSNHNGCWSHRDHHTGERQRGTSGGSNSPTDWNNQKRWAWLAVWSVLQTRWSRWRHRICHDPEVCHAYLLDLSITTFVASRALPVIDICPGTRTKRRTRPIFIPSTSKSSLESSVARACWQILCLTWSWNHVNMDLKVDDWRPTRPCTYLHAKCCTEPGSAAKAC